MPEESRQPTPDNATLFQGFEWNVPADQKHYKRLTAQIPQLSHIGVTSIWLPPGCKASSKEGNGYDIYDLYDLGEFEQKGSRSTKWGSKEELLELSAKAKENGITLYWDAVLNHKAGADKTETCKVVEVDPNDRTKDVSDAHEIDAWVGFDFPGRGDKYSGMKWHWYHFSGTDWDQKTKKKAIYRIVGENKGWSGSVDTEQGNDDYMMFADIDYHHPEVSDDTMHWGPWITKEIGLKGFRLDAVQHFSENFTSGWVDNLRKECGDDMFIVGEFWVGDTKKMTEWLGKMEKKFGLFDAPLLYNFHNLSKTEKADLRKVFDNSLVQVEPVNAVTCVQNHDTQKGQTVETPVEDWFKPLAYSLILLRSEGYPTLFYGDLYGTQGKFPQKPSCGDKLPDIALARKLYAYGEQDNYMEEASCIGWVRRGTWDKVNGLAVVMSNASPGQRKMLVGKEHANETWTDILGWEQTETKIDDEGWGVFNCPGVSVAIWVNKDAQGRDQFPAKFDADIYKSA